MTNTHTEILLIGPLVFAELEDRSSGKKALVIANEPAELEDYCDKQDVEYPSLMPTEDRWQAPIYAVDDGEARVRIMPRAMDVVAVSTLAGYTLYVQDGKVTTFCPSTKTTDYIKEVVETYGCLKVLGIHPADAGSLLIN
jgi:hypothetical protein